ncbi:MAG: SDR family oxidoreductase [Nitriliruptoraceae bacterium]
MNVLVLGATGYVGGRLVPELLAAGHRVRCFARTPEKLATRPWRSDVDVVAGDANDIAALTDACTDMDAVIFLIHAMDGQANFAQREAAIARAVRDATTATGVKRLVYLGGLGDDDKNLSEHLSSRHVVGTILRESSARVSELRAGVIIGSGSTSFEMLRHLVEMLPAMVTPKWVGTRTQPIGIGDVLRYLVGVLELDADGIFEIGGPDVLTYHDMMRRYAELAGLRRRLILPVPLLTPRLSSLWIGLVTPLPAGIARPLVDSLVTEVTVTDDRIRSLLPFELMNFDDAVRAALQRIQDLDVASTWASAGPAGPAVPAADDPSWAGGKLFVDEQRLTTHASLTDVFATITSIGGRNGYFSSQLLWRLRGTIDKAVGGIGLRRGRRHPTELWVGDPIDFWRVEALDPPHLLRLRAEMLLPGTAWLEFHVKTLANGRTGVIQRARFAPRGIAGRAYWYAVTPFHRFVFPAMLRRLIRHAETRNAK